MLTIEITTTCNFWLTLVPASPINHTWDTLKTNCVGFESKLLIFIYIHTKRAKANNAQRWEKAEPLGEGKMRGRVSRHRACKSEREGAGRNQRVRREREGYIQRFNIYKDFSNPSWPPGRIWKNNQQYCIISENKYHSQKITNFTRFLWVGARFWILSYRAIRWITKLGLIRKFPSTSQPVPGQIHQL